MTRTVNKSCKYHVYHVQRASVLPALLGFSRSLSGPFMGLAWIYSSTGQKGVVGFSWASWGVLIVYRWIYSSTNIKASPGVLGGDIGVLLAAWIAFTSRQHWHNVRRRPGSLQPSQDFLLRSCPDRVQNLTRFLDRFPDCLNFPMISWECSPASCLVLSLFRKRQFSTPKKAPSKCTI